jgi:hypothetical protein
MALTPENELFVLDLFETKQPEAALIRATFDMADRWDVHAVHVEVVRSSHNLYANMLSVARTRLLSSSSPFAILPLRPPNHLDKTTKIASLALRFEHGLIKLPVGRDLTPPWSHLFDQINSFNPDSGADAGLSKDDHIDCVAMSSFVIKGRPLQRGVPSQREPVDPIAEIAARRFRTRSGLPHAFGLSLREIPTDLLLDLSQPPETTSTDTLA